MAKASLARVRRRLKDKFRFYSEKALKIRTKDLEVVPFVINEAQDILDEVVERQLRTTGRVRVIILKGRQQGISTYVGGRIYHAVSQSKAARAAVITHKSDATETLFTMTKRYHDNVPEILRPSTTYSSRRELVFDLLDSSYMVATAGGGGVARGETISHLHASELAFWKAAIARENWNGLRQAVADAKGSMIFIESTANGVGNLFHELWQGAVNGTNEYEAVFIPWFVQWEYRRDAPDSFEPTPDEQELIDQFALDYDQLYWRRLKIGDSGLELFQQEYPCTPEEAFLTSGRPVFDNQQIMNRLAELKAEPPRSRTYALEGEAAWDWREHPRGELRVFREPSPIESYFIGADVGAGIKGQRKPNGEYEKDPSVAVVLDSQRRQVAVWRGYVLPDYFGYILNALGQHYNCALVAVESNNHGILPLHVLSKTLFYPHLYQEVIVDRATEEETVRLGFTTTVKSKPLVIDQLRGDMRDKLLTVNCATTLNEMLTFVQTPSGKMEGEEGQHDDTVMALAIANFVHDGEWTGVENTDDFYVEAI